MSAILEQQPHFIWHHLCPFVGAEINEIDPRLLDCMCFEGSRFLAAQDALALKIDSSRAPRLITETAVSPAAPGLESTNGSALENANVG